MGGNALKHVGVKRISTDDMMVVRNELYNLFTEYLDIDFVPFVKEKQDHGDIDVLVCSKSTDTVKNILMRVYNPEHTVFNGNVISFAYKYNDNLYQVDFISTGNIMKEKFYMSYGILGLIIGRMATRSNLVFDGGLKVSIYGSTLNNIVGTDEFFVKQKYSDIRLTNDPIEVCRFLGMSYDRWLQGFETNNDLYDWLLTCNIFKKSCFEFKEYNRPRIIDRSKGFAIYCKDFDDKEDNTLERVFERFSIMDKIIEIVEKERRKANIKSKYSAQLIMDKGIKNEKIGECVKYLKSQFDDFDEWVYQNDKETVINQVNDLIDNFINR